MKHIYLCGMCGKEIKTVIYWKVHGSYCTVYPSCKKCHKTHYQHRTPSPRIYKEAVLRYSTKH